MDVNEVKILLVDDEADVLDFMKYNLEKEGFQVSTAGDGVEAIQLAKKIAPQLIILDFDDAQGDDRSKLLVSAARFKNTIIAFLPPAMKIILK